jgi:hypothetical protein
MRSDELIQKVDELFQDFEKPDFKKIEELVIETLQFFEYIREKLQSTNGDDRQDALEEAQLVQKKLEELSQRALTSSGMTQEQLTTFLSNPQNFSQQEWDQFRKVEGDINQYQNQINKHIKP